MSGLGMLATALAGGAGVIGKQAGDDIADQRKSELMKQQAEIDLQYKQRLAEFSADLDRRSNKNRLIDTRDFNASDETIAATGKVAKAAGATARDVERERLGDTALNEAARKKAADDAAAKAESEAGILKSQAGDKKLVEAIGVMELAKPQVRAQIAASMASAGASAQSVKESAERLKQLQQVGEVATKVRGLQDTLTKTSDPAQRQAVEQQITDLGFSGKDVKSFLSTAERAMTNGDTAMKILMDQMADEATKATARAQLDRANQFADQAAGLAGIKTKGQERPTEQQAHAEAEGAIKQGASREAVNAKLAKLGYQPLGSTAKPAGMIPNGARAADDFNDRNIKRVEAGYGTSYYRYAGKNYQSKQAAEAAKAEWDKTPAEDIFNTPN